MFTVCDECWDKDMKGINDDLIPEVLSLCDEVQKALEINMEAQAKITKHLKNVIRSAEKRKRIREAEEKQLQAADDLANAANNFQIAWYYDKAMGGTNERLLDALATYEKARGMK